MARYYLVQYDGAVGAWVPPASWKAHHDAIAAGTSDCMKRLEWSEALGVAMIETCDCCQIDADWAIQTLTSKSSVAAHSIAIRDTLAGRSANRGR